MNTEPHAIFSYRVMLDGSFGLIHTIWSDGKISTQKTHDRPYHPRLLDLNPPSEIERVGQMLRKQQRYSRR